MPQFGLRNLLALRWQNAGSDAAGVAAEQWPDRVYAIGDIHGRYDLLCALERTIIADAGSEVQDAVIVTLGDMIDRGPQSRDVLNHLMRPLAGFRRIALMGNHEAMLLDFLKDPVLTSIWLHNGGVETLRSFELDVAWLMDIPFAERRQLLKATFGEPVVQFIQSLPVFASFPGTVLVHAGIRPGVRMSQQRRADLLWIREPFLNADRNDGLLVVHGHTPSGLPQFGRGRLGIDTFAYKSGVLTAVCLQRDEPLRLLAVGPVLMWPQTA